MVEHVTSIMRSQRGRNRAILGIAAAVLIGGMALRYDARIPEGGPILAANPSGWASPQHTGDRFLDGNVFLRLETPGTEHDIEILEVRSIGLDEGLREVGTWVAGPDRGTNIPAWEDLEAGLGRFTGYEPALGAVVHLAKSRTPQGPDFDAEILIGYEVVGSGILQRDGVEVVYRVDDNRTYRLYFPTVFTVCTDVPADDCEVTLE